MKAKVASHGDSDDCGSAGQRVSAGHCESSVSANFLSPSQRRKKRANLFIESSRYFFVTRVSGSRGRGSPSFFKVLLSLFRLGFFHW